MQETSGQFPPKGIAPLTLGPDLSRRCNPLPGHRDRLIDASSLVERIAAVRIAAPHLLDEAQATGDYQRLPGDRHSSVEIADRAEIPAHRVEHVRFHRLGSHRASETERLCAAST